jgi:hypothetical protein
VVFIGDAGDPNPTVSRNHAHIDLTSKPTEFRLYDDRSAHGTSILRNGHTISPRGVRLQAEDEIVLGEASLRVEIVVGGFAGCEVDGRIYRNNASRLPSRRIASDPGLA